MLREPASAQLESIVHEKIRLVLEERGIGHCAIDGADRLHATLGLSSLDLAVIVAELESALGVDPFLNLVPITSMRSVDDLVEAYRRAYSPPPDPAGEDAELVAASRRGEARRTRRAGK